MGERLVPRLIAGALSLACLLAPAAPANAAGRVLTPSGSPLRLEAVRAAESRASGWATVWLSFRVAGDKGKFAVVLPVPPGSRIDPSLDAFFDALDHATAPRILPPDAAPACGETEDKSFEDTSAARVPSLAATGVAVLGSVAETQEHAADLGLAFDDADKKALDEIGVGTRFVVLSYQSPSTSAVTESVRITLPSANAPLALGLARSLDFVPDVTIFTIGEGRAAIADVEELEPASIGATWTLLTGKSDYLAERRLLLLEKQGSAWVAETSGSDPLFGWTLLPKAAATVTPAVKRYLDYALADGAVPGPVSNCLTEVLEAVQNGKLGARVSRACADGALADLGAASCSEAPGAGEHPAAALRCEGADDLAFLLSGLLANQARVTRHAGVAGAAAPALANFSVGPGAVQSIGVTASESDASGCVLGNAGSGGGPGSNGGGSGDGGAYGGGAYGGSDDYVGPAEPANDDPNVAVEVSCWSSTDSGGDSCGGDSSSSSEGDGDTCSGDSSSDSSSEGDTCSGDSSGDSSADGDTCGGDSGSSGGDGETCSGDGAGDSGGDTCSGSGSSGSSSGDCSVTRVKPRRARMSALTLLLCALALPIRRWSRRKRR
jgi:hypothetical protein